MEKQVITYEDGSPVFLMGRPLHVGDELDTFTREGKVEVVRTEGCYIRTRDEGGEESLGTLNEMAAIYRWPVQS